VITLTPRGQSVVDEAVGAGLAVQRAVLERLPPRSRTQLSALLRELLAAAEAAPEIAPEIPPAIAPEAAAEPALD
jgi:hypothetical protein